MPSCIALGSELLFKPHTTMIARKCWKITLQITVTECVIDVFLYLLVSQVKYLDR